MWDFLYGIREQVGAGEWGISLEDDSQDGRTGVPLAQGLVCDNTLSKGFIVRKKT